MTPKEIQEIIEKQEELGLRDAVLKITKSPRFRQTSQYLMTPFGKCLSRYVRTTSHGCPEFIIFVPISNMKKWLERYYSNETT